MTRYVLKFRGVRTHWRQPKGRLALFHIAAFIGATLCGIIHLHGYAVRLFSGFVVKSFVLQFAVLSYFASIFFGALIPCVLNADTYKSTYFFAESSHEKSCVMPRSCIFLISFFLLCHVHTAQVTVS